MSGECRENVFTVFARNINALCEHKISKEELFFRFVNLIEIADENEKQERAKFELEMNEWNNLDLSEKTGAKRPYSNFEAALNMLR